MNMEKEVHILNLDDVLPNRFQPRIVFDEKAINELTESIKEHGVIQPIVVRKVADKYEIIAGERRYKASVLAGKNTIPAIVTDLNDKDSAEIALIENVQRQNLTPIEEAVSYKKILDMGYLNQSDLATKLGKTQSTIANKLRLLNLSDKVQEALLEERISERHARSLLRLEGNKQDAMLDRIISERMTVRKTDEEIAKMLSSDTTDESNTQKVIEPIKEEKGEEKMENNSFVNNFNIPTGEIKEVQPVRAEDFLVKEAPVQQPVTPVEPVMAPPVAPVEPAASVAPIQQSAEQPIVQPFSPIGPGFMSIIEDPKPAQSVEELKPIGEVPVQQAMQQPVTPSPEQIAPVAPAMVPPVSPVEPAAPVVETPVESQQPETPVQGRFFTMFNDEEVTNAEPVAATPSPEPVATVAPVEPQQTTEPAANAMFGFNPFGPVQEPVAPVAPVEPVSMEEPIPMPKVAVTPEMNANTTFNEQVQTFEPFKLNDNQEFTNTSVVEMGNIGMNRMEEPTLEPLMETGDQFERADMKTVINAIRECAKQIERYGYVVDTDELDFDDSYQVTFKIDKGE